MDLKIITKFFFMHLIEQKIRLAYPDPGSSAFYLLDPGSGMQFFSIPDPAPFFGEIFLHYVSSESFICYLYETGLLLKLCRETVNSKKNVIFLLLPPFYLGSWVRDLRSGRRKFTDPDPG
jgi:hypothetical protein